jgi:hypothetical protein
MSRKSRQSIDPSSTQLSECLHCFEKIPNSKFIRHVRQCQSKRSRSDPDVDNHPPLFSEQDTNMLVDGNADPTDVFIEDNVYLPSDQHPSDLVHSDSNDVDEDSVSGIFGDSYLELVLMDGLETLESPTTL